MRVLIVDDTTLFRKIVSDAISSDPDVEVVGRSSNGVLGLKQIRNLQPDLVTLDLEMPEMNGIEVLEAINKEKLNVGVIVISAHTTKGGERTLEALQKGAFDFITKPDLGSTAENQKWLSDQLLPMFRAWMKKNGKSMIAKVKEPEKVIIPPKIMPVSSKKPEMVALGISTGGPEALRKVLPLIPASFNKPILIVQHMPALFTTSLANMLNRICELSVKEAEDGDIIEPGWVYIAPGGRQMKARKEMDGKKVIQITDDPPVNHCRPAVDYLFRSLANHFPGKVMSVIMTGMGNDGCLGVKLLKRHGCFSLVQDEDSSAVFGMPGAVVKEGMADLIVPLERIAETIVSVGS